MSVSGMTGEEMGNSLTGFDEIAISKSFGGSFDALEGSIGARSIVFVWHRRQGLTDAEAYKAAMEMPVSGMADFFDDEPDEVMADEPETDAGKDFSPLS